MNNNVVDGIIASMLFVVLSSLIGFILQTFGLNTPLSLSIAVAVFLVLFLVGRRHYPKFKRKLTLRLIENVLNSEDNDDLAFKNQIIARVIQDHPTLASNQLCPVRVFANQIACEDEICEAFRVARKVKILTIRGEKYFLSSRSLLYELYLSRKTKDSTVDVLVLSLNSDHITEALAKKLGHDDAEHIRVKMGIALDNLKHLAEKNNKFMIKCYTETPNLKILLFDDVMFVSSFAEGGGRKNDENTTMWQITREDNPIFTGLEKHFDDLWKRSIAP